MRKEYKQNLSEELTDVTDSIQDEKVEDVCEGYLKGGILEAGEQVVCVKELKVRRWKGNV